MSDDLIISGGGAVAVATDELLGTAQQLSALAAEVRSIHSRLELIDEMVSPAWLRLVGAPVGAITAESSLETARLVLRDVETRANAMHWALNTVADNYGFAEKTIGYLVRQIAGTAGAIAGRAAVMFAITTIGGLAALGILGGLVGGSNAAGGLGRAICRSDRKPDPADGAFAREHNEAITNPLVVSAIRQAVQSLGGVAAGVTGVPVGVLDLLGPGGLAFAAGGIMRGGSVVGLTSETPVRLGSRHSLEVGGPPSGYADRLDRVPDPDKTGGAQVVIEKYSQAGHPDRFEVYIGGTVSFSPVAASDPWDLTSNIANTAGGDGGSYRAVAAAMELAGVEADNPVQFTGYSQGGGTAARLAASGDYNTVGLTTFGAPTGQVSIPDGFPTVLVEHMDDIVPALGGEQDNRHAVVVERDVFGGRPVPEEYAVPAHHLEYYQQTAALMDHARSDQVTDAAAQLHRFSEGATAVTSTAYRYERVSDSCDRP